VRTAADGSGLVLSAGEDPGEPGTGDAPEPAAG
jgi:hypothetical protein